MASVVVSMLAIQLKGYGIQSHPPLTTPTGKFISTAAPPVSNHKKNGNKITDKICFNY